MPQYGLKYIKAAPYQFSSDTVSYGAPIKVGDAIMANLEVERAEGSLYAEDGKAEFVSEVVGGAISLGVKYIMNAAQKLLLGVKDDSRSITYTPTSGGSAETMQVSGLKIGAGDRGSYVGVGFYSPDMVDHENKFFCMFVRKTRFGPPSLSLQTKNNSIQFQTPTISGQFLKTDDNEGGFYAWALVDDENAARAWVDASFGA